METSQANKKPPIYRQQTTYYETLFRRHNAFKEMMLNFFFNICSWPRLILEVFIRRNMGERYFSMPAVLCIFVFLMFTGIKTLALGYMLYNPGKGKYMGAGLMIFSFVFLYFGWQRRQEIKRLPSVYDFKRFSLSTGETLEYFDKYTKDRRKLTTIYEPGACFLAGLVLLLLFQVPLALMLMNCSVIYSLSYFAAYHQGDNYIMDKIDERICLEDLGRTYSQNIPYNKTRGAEYFGYQAETEAERQRMAGRFDADTAYEVN